jgi:Phosphotransferase enzyme family
MTRITAWMLGQLPGDLAGATVVRERHRRDSSWVLLESRVRGRAIEVAALYQRADQSLQRWAYPDDPFLPALAGAAELLRSAGVWARPWMPADAAPGLALGRRLMYNPGQRAAFLVSLPGGRGDLVLKLLRREQFGPSLERYLALERAGLTRSGMVPALVSYAPGAGALLYRYVPGTPLDQIEPQAVGAADLTDALTGIHAAAVPGLGRWEAAAEVGRTRMMVDDLARWHPAAARALTPLLAEIGARLTGAAGDLLCHGDCTARNLLRAATGRLAAIDWDSAQRAPAERDLASMLPTLRQLGVDQGRFLDTYQERAARPIDRGLLGALAQYQRLIKLARRAFRDGEAAAPRIAEGAAQIAAQLT